MHTVRDAPGARAHLPIGRGSRPREHCASRAAAKTDGCKRVTIFWSLSLWTCSSWPVGRKSSQTGVRFFWRTNQMDSQHGGAREDPLFRAGTRRSGDGRDKEPTRKAALRAYRIEAAEVAELRRGWSRDTWRVDCVLLREPNADGASTSVQSTGHGGEKTR